MKSGAVEQPNDDWLKNIYERSRKETKMLPNLFKVMANAPELLQSYLDTYKLFSQHSGFTPEEQQIIFLVISYENGCNYCLAAHSTVANFSAGLSYEVTDAICNDTAIPVSKYQLLADFTREMLWSRGRPSESKTTEFLSAGYTEKQILDIILAISLKTLSNYTNHLYNTPIDSVFKAQQSRIGKLAARVFQSFNRNK
ncbi:24 kDa macrophage-induced major protein [Legionella birminghamensis]|uniref:24 kDa macrophage-induced major protein n=2 Tax=Legionella birminghamensis TaxID=28083 RepID=A0A378IBS2_9GAMM|nr:24 kDa macrophage-induced major protein [Legionella birminghamensis]STX32668.1 24 kDa macrophage-induced major protein [Legionella birminghamensis]